MTPILLTYLSILNSPLGWHISQWFPKQAIFPENNKARLPLGNPAISIHKDPWLSVTSSRWVWLSLRCEKVKHTLMRFSRNF